MSKPLRVGINELVVAYAKSQLDAGELVDIAQMTHEIAQSLVDVIMQQEDDQGFLFAYALASLGDEYMQQHGLSSDRRQ